jgi:large subunit ribosomal protein L30
MATTKKKMIRITLVKSTVGRLKAHIDCARGLGIRYLNHTVEVLDTPENRGMINKISYLLKIEG